MTATNLTIRKSYKIIIIMIALKWNESLTKIVKTQKQNKYTKKDNDNGSDNARHSWLYFDCNFNTDTTSNNINKLQMHLLYLGCIWFVVCNCCKSF